MKQGGLKANIRIFCNSSLRLQTYTWNKLLAFARSKRIFTLLYFPSLFLIPIKVVVSLYTTVNHKHLSNLSSLLTISS